MAMAGLAESDEVNGKMRSYGELVYMLMWNKASRFCCQLSL